MQTDKRITSKSKNDVVRENHLCLVFCVLLFCFTISHFFILSVESAEVSDTDSNQMEGSLAAILNSERINPEPTKPLTEPLLEIVTELPDSELMVPFLELIYAVTPSEGETLEEVYVKVNGVFDRHLYQKKRENLKSQSEHSVKLVSFFLPMNRKTDLNWSPSIVVTKGLIIP